MRLPRNARIFRGQLDFTPFASMFFLLVIFMMLGGLAYTPGVRIQLPVADDLPGTDQPTVKVAVDASGRLYFNHQLIEADQLQSRLREEVERAGQSLTLVVYADKDLTQERLERLLSLARGAGLQEALLARLPRLVTQPGEQSAKP
jgi:biopolymer transport protein ExbD